jgi:hypothetical protein
MRLIGQLPHPRLKISVFKNDQRLSIKFEQPHQEITLKMGDNEHFRTLEDAERFVDAPLCAAIEQQLATLHQTRLQALNRHVVQTEVADDEFDTII